MNINEHLKKIGIGFGIGAGLLVLLYFIGISPLLSARKENLKKIEKAESEKEQNRMLLQRSDEIVKNYQENGRKLYEIIHNKLASSENKSPFSWISNLIQNIASKHGVSIENVSRAGISRRGGQSGRDAPVPQLEGFAVNLDLRAEFHDFGRFLAEVEKRLPYSRIDSIIIKGEGKRRDLDSGGNLSISMRNSVLRFTRETFPPSERPDEESIDVSENLTNQGLKIE